MFRKRDTCVSVLRERGGRGGKNIKIGELAVERKEEKGEQFPY